MKKLAILIMSTLLLAGCVMPMHGGPGPFPHMDGPHQESHRGGHGGRH